ncbi:MAG: hypothetical protein ACJAT1_001275 [Marivirga sp.]|jgi:hypothetical protein
MENLNGVIESKIIELSSYGYVNLFNFSSDHLELKKVKEDESIEVKSYVVEQISVEAEYLYEEEGTAVVTLMTSDGQLGYVIDQINKKGEYPAITYFESLED